MVYIYTLSDPLSGEVRYVGKTKNLKRRFQAHISKARARQVDHHCARWVRTLINRGELPQVAVFMAVPDDQDWQEAERISISEHRRAGYDLTNLTGGGDGFHDCDPVILKRRGESRRKALLDPVKRSEHVARLAAARMTAEVRRKQSDGVRRAWSDPEKGSAMLAGIRGSLWKRAAAAKRRQEAREDAENGFYLSIWPTYE